MSAYLIVHRHNITDSTSLKSYADGVDETIEHFGGEVIVRNDRFDVLEGNWSSGKPKDDGQPERVTVLRFPNKKALMSWYKSDAYANLKSVRQHSSMSDVIAVDGMDGYHATKGES